MHWKLGVYPFGNINCQHAVAVVVVMVAVVGFWELTLDCCNSDSLRRWPGPWAAVVAFLATSGTKLYQESSYIVSSPQVVKGLSGTGVESDGKLWREGGPRYGAGSVFPPPLQTGQLSSLGRKLGGKSLAPTANGWSSEVQSGARMFTRSGAHGPCTGKGPGKSAAQFKLSPERIEVLVFVDDLTTCKRLHLTSLHFLNPRALPSHFIGILYLMLSSSQK